MDRRDVHSRGLTLVFSREAYDWFRGRAAESGDGEVWKRFTGACVRSLSVPGIGDAWEIFFPGTGGAVSQSFRDLAVEAMGGAAWYYRGALDGILVRMPSSRIGYEGWCCMEALEGDPPRPKDGVEYRFIGDMEPEHLPACPARAS